ncbi:C-terminal helicase domain-containing protein [Propioniciclava sp. MC1595]|uniref:helicase-related protein n=1 Tax=Propioniciclava sp. MC1595 TaxID=2760308 RepID=UPI001CB79618|nr:C-terminal helicase domain-containing protein [Propioniciclava sp. MC1595]
MHSCRKFVQAFSGVGAAPDPETTEPVPGGPDTGSVRAAPRGRRARGRERCAVSACGGVRRNGSRRPRTRQHPASSPPSARTSSPISPPPRVGRSFTRTKHGAKKLAKQLNGRGIPAVDLHGNLSQNARVRNLEAFDSGRVETLVATDIAARGIHVDDVALVVHADPPTEYKAYLHRSGRTARAGSSGTVITIATPDQRGDVQGLMRAAKISPTVTPASADVLRDLAPGERRVLSAAEVAERTPSAPVQQQPTRARRPRAAQAPKASLPQGSRGQRAGRAASGAAPTGSTRGAAAFSASAGRATGRRRSR